MRGVCRGALYQTCNPRQSCSSLCRISPIHPVSMAVLLGKSVSKHVWQRERAVCVRVDGLASGSLADYSYKEPPKSSWCLPPKCGFSLFCLSSFLLLLYSSRTYLLPPAVCKGPPPCTPPPILLFPLCCPSITAALCPGCYTEWLNISFFISIHS